MRYIYTVLVIVVLWIAPAWALTVDMVDEDCKVKGKAFYVYSVGDNSYWLTAGHMLVLTDAPYLDTPDGVYEYERLDWVYDSCTNEDWARLRIRGYTPDGQPDIVMAEKLDILHFTKKDGKTYCFKDWRIFGNEVRFRIGAIGGESGTPIYNSRDELVAILTRGSNKYTYAYIVNTPATPSTTEPGKDSGGG